MNPVGLVESCRDPELFDIELHPRQREILAAIEAGPPIHVLACGRRSGKTLIGALVALHSCLFRPDLDAMIRPGEGRLAVVVATNLQQARLLVAAARSIIDRSRLLGDAVTAVTDDSIRFANGTELRAFPCSSRGGRGWPISCLVMDEAAHFLTETDGYQAAEQVWRALVPSTAQFGEAARLVVASTPYGSQGLFAELFEQAQSGELADAVAHHAPTAEMNPAISAAVLDREQRRDPDGFRAEYLAEFTSAGDAYLDFDRFEIADRDDLGRAAGRDWIIGLDPAFARDPFGFAVVGRHRWDRDKLLLARAGALRPRGGFTEPVDAVARIATTFGARIVTDQYAAAAVVERLRGHGLTVRAHNMTAPSKTAIFAELRARLYAGELSIHHHPELIGELRRLRTRFTAGQAAVENPRVGGSHGDIAQALALAVYELRRRGGGHGVRVGRKPEGVVLDV